MEAHLAELIKRSHRERERYRQAKATLAAEKLALVEAESVLVDATEAQRIIQMVAKTVQQEAHHKIAGLVSRCLAAVYDEPYKFRITFEAKRGKTEALFSFEDSEGHEIDPLTASGGGMVDVAAFALRLSAVMLTKQRPRRLLILDEPFRFVSARFQPNVAILLEELARELKMRIIMVTHSPTLAVGNHIKV